MKVKLNLLERLTLNELLPKNTDYVTGLKVQELAKQLMPSDQEFKKYLKRVENRIVIKNDGMKKTKEVKIGEICLTEITKILKNKNDKRELNQQELSLYGKFIENK